MQEIILKKEAVYKTEIDTHLFETIFYFINENKKDFLSRSWDCNIKTSLNLFPNILHDVAEFKYIRKNITDKIEDMLIYNTGSSQPFCIESSWVNVLNDHGYQEFHKHTNCAGSGVLYLSDNSSDIEFSVFPEDLRTKITPEKGDLIMFNSSTFHRVLESNKERLSLAFNFIGGKNG